MDRVLFKAMLYNLITLKMYVLMPIFKSGNLGFLSDHLSFWHLKKIGWIMQNIYNWCWASALT